MRRLPLLFFVVCYTFNTFAVAHAQPPKGSNLPPEENGCALCHGESRLWRGEQQKLYVAAASLAEDVHTLAGVNCHDCHGGDPTTLNVDRAHQTGATEGSTLPLRTLAQVKESCTICHDSESMLLQSSVHANVDRGGEGDVGRVLTCNECHGERTHGMLKVSDRRSPVFPDHQVQLCGSCHEQYQASFTTTVHGKGMFRAGLVVSATCSSCHGAHGIFQAGDERSTLHLSNVDVTCSRCHHDMGDRLRASVHGRGHGPGRAPDDVGANANYERNPNCTDCHLGHRLLHPQSDEFRLELSSRCRDCHPQSTSSYLMSTHGQLSELGYSPAATCSDCHGAHEIAPLSDPSSRLALGSHRLATCRQCHVRAVMNFSQFDTHADHKNAKAYPKLNFIYRFTRTLFLGFFLFFVIHGFFWFARSFVAVLRHGRHRTLVAGQYVLVKNEPMNRLVYVCMLASFLGLTVTGLPLKYSSQRWAQLFVQGLGGFESTSVWHRFFGAALITFCIIHFVRGLRQVRKRRTAGFTWSRILFGSDSPVPGARDVKDLLGMTRWFVGLGPKPSFERWTYWEKWDYWMACLAFAVIGTSGLMMWYPNVFCRFISGESLNVARVFHVELALLSTSLLFVFHLFHTHFRPEKFPLDLSSITGLVSEDHLRQQRPDYIARLERNGEIERMRRPAPTARHLWASLFMGVTLFSLGIGLLMVAIAAALGQ
jgi:cytochrome b subunit of formate dehydrogenase